MRQHRWLFLNELEALPDDLFDCCPSITFLCAVARARVRTWPPTSSRRRGQEPRVQSAHVSAAGDRLTAGPLDAVRGGPLLHGLALLLGGTTRASLRRNLRWNRISSIADDSLQGLGRLRTLCVRRRPIAVAREGDRPRRRCCTTADAGVLRDLGWNTISAVSPGAFDGLGALTSLCARPAAGACRSRGCRLTPAVARRQGRVTQQARYHAARGRVVIAGTAVRGALHVRDSVHAWMLALLLLRRRRRRSDMTENALATLPPLQLPVSLTELCVAPRDVMRCDVT